MSNDKLLKDRAINALSSREIKELIKTLNNEAYPEISLKLMSDKRKSVRQLGEKLEREYNKIQLEKLRMIQMLSFENEAIKDNYNYVVGIDEAGRGPLVGPVVAGAVILDMTKDWSGINDSKKLTEAKRNYFYDKICREALYYGVGIATHLEIEEINILNASKLAMKRALSSIVDQVPVDLLLIDAVKLDDINIDQKNIIKGDMKSASIAAASILAKVMRDRIMVELHEKYPMYHFDKNKGYGTKDHYSAIESYGILPDHRRSFLKNIL